MTRLASLQAERASCKLRFEAAWRVGDGQAEMMAMLELEDLDAQIKRELERIEKADE